MNILFVKVILSNGMKFEAALVGVSSKEVFFALLLNVDAKRVPMH